MHAVDDAAFLFQSESISAPISHFQKTARPVHAHASQDRANCLPAHDPGHCSEEYVNARLVTGNGIGLYQTAIGKPRRMDGEVTATRCQIDVPCLKKLVMLGKRDLRRALAVKP